eukprot:5559787-Pyramimonas_sp.AAC.1
MCAPCGEVTPICCHREAACVTRERGTPVASKTCSSVALPSSDVEPQMNGARIRLHVTLAGM